MDDSDDQPRPTPDARDVRDHLANERTLLAWARTSLAIMALGFVVARFGLLLRELGYGLSYPLPRGTSSIFGTALVICGAILMALALARYVSFRRQIERQQFNASPWLNVALAVFIVVAAIVMAVYLLVTG
jgi:putative membrane protein